MNLLKKLGVYSGLILCLLVATSCSVFNVSGKRPPSRVEYEKKQIVLDSHKKHALEAERKLVGGAQESVEEATDALMGLKELWNSSTKSIETVKQEGLDYLDGALESLSTASRNLTETHKFISLFQSIEGRPTYDVSLEKPNLQKLRDDIKEQSTVVSREEGKFVNKLSKYDSQMTSSSSSPLTGLWNIIKFVVLGILVLGGILGVVYVRVIYGKSLAIVAGVLGASIIGAYVWLSYNEIVIHVATIALSIAAILGVGYGLVVLFRSKAIIKAVEQIRESLPAPYKEKVDDIFKREYTSGTDKFVKRIKRANEIEKLELDS